MLNGRRPVQKPRKVEDAKGRLQAIRNELARWFRRFFARESKPALTILNKQMHALST